MNLLKKLFSKKEAEFTPDNTKLWELLNAYAADASQSNYKKVFEELNSETAYLIVPTANETQTASDKWTTLKTGATIQFTTVFNLEGLLVIGVFSSPEKLSLWATKEMTYTAMPAKVVLEIAQEQSFGRIVIDSNQDTMFILERDTSNIKSETVKEDTQVMVGMPACPIDGANKESLLREFAKNTNISEVYHFLMTRHNENILILAFALEQDSDNARKAIFATINNGMDGFELDLPLDIMYIKPGDSWYDTAKEHECFYRK